MYATTYIHVYIHTYIHTYIHIYICIYTCYVKKWCFSSWNPHWLAKVEEVELPVEKVDIIISEWMGGVARVDTT